MTVPERDPIGSTLDTTLRLTVAISQLVEPGVHHLDRSRAATDPDVAATTHHTDTSHREQMAVLQRRHAAARARRDHAGMRRTLQALIARERAHQAAATARAADTVPVPSLLAQLEDAVESSQGTGGGTVGPHRSPIGLNAAELLGHIQHTVRWRPDEPLADRVRAWAGQPPDPAEAADLAERWVADARAIVTPDRGFEVRGACPICGTRYVWVLQDGERVRRSALQVTYATRSARCIAHGCTGRWGPEWLEHLTRVVVQDRDERAG